MSKGQSYPSREDWPLIWFGALILTLVIFDRSHASTLTNWMLVAGIWGGLTLLWKLADPYSVYMPEPKSDDPYLQGALAGGIVALMASAAVIWLFPAFARATEVSDDEGGGPSLSSILAMIAVYMVARMTRIKAMRKETDKRIGQWTGSER